MDPVRALYADHDELVMRLQEMEDLCVRAERGAEPPGLAAALGAMIDRLREEVDVHSDKEEIGLLPVLRSHRLPEDLLETLLDEHEGVRAHVHDFAIEAGLWLSGGRSREPAWIGPARLARGLLSTHIQKENLLVFPLAERLLTAEERAEVADAFARLDGGGA